MGSTGNLVRKQYLVSEDNIDKLEKLASARGTSAADIVRQAIDAYDPHGAQDMEAPELMELVSEKLKEAISATKKANRKVAKALKSLDTVKA
jgi:predicted DNA-binding protein